MKRFVTCALLFLLGAGFAMGQDGVPEVAPKANTDAPPKVETGNQSEAAPETVSPPKIEAKADDALKQMCDYLSGLKSFSFTTEDCNDVIQDDGLKLQFSTQLEAHVQRPDRIASERKGDTGHRKSVYNGAKKTLTAYDPKVKAFSELDVPDTIDELFNFIAHTYGAAATPPLADFMLSDPYSVFKNHAISGVYVGLHQVSGVPCHHLAFRGQGLDWQIWVDAGEQPLPRKVVFSFKREAGGPQYVSRFTSWTVNPEFDDTRFEIAPPSDAEKVDIPTKQ